jgi:hypothetical protein
LSEPDTDQDYKPWDYRQIPGSSGITAHNSLSESSATGIV